MTDSSATAIPTLSTDRYSLPALGFGTYRLWGTEGAQSTVSALTMGYRLIDSAYNYENEGTIGAGIRDAIDKGIVTRDDVIVTSKLPGRYHDHDKAINAIEESVYRTGLDYIDLYLIHWPNPKQGKYVEAWKALMEARDRGLVRHIGVCNFTPEHLETLDRETGELPVINQIELHPYFNQAEARAYHQEHGIITESWSPIARGTVFNEDTIVSIAQKHEATVGQVVLAWHRALGALAIPKSASHPRQQENLDSLNVTLTHDEVEAINGLTKPDGRQFDQDPTEYEEF
ncbi:aldo/keto reductase [Corynebacterium kroppenstedtii]|uniref:aldo/keto reductase n=1 Tax=Corynebacterium sp. PCR 32 TaxID=3351342 RepID=UPI0030AFB456